MLRFLLDKFKQTPGPLKEARLIVGDIAEEILDLAEYYLKRATSHEQTHAAAFRSMTFLISQMKKKIESQKNLYRRR
jgi:hypothetical protein